MRNHRLSVLGMIIVAFVLLLLNLRIPEWTEHYRIDTNKPPDDVDFVTRALFFRGWPFTPVEYCGMSGFRWRPDGWVQLAALADVAIFVGAVLTTGLICELFARRGGRPWIAHGRNDLAS